MSSTSPPPPPRRSSVNETRLAAIFGWITVASTGLLLASGLFNALWRGLPSRWGQAAAFTIFVLAHVGSIGRKRPPIARALASLLFLAFVLELYWFSWGPQDGTVFAWSNLTLESVRDGLLLWGLGLGALVLTLAPPRAHTRLLGSMLGLFLMTPWIWGLSRGSSRVTIIAGPEWLDWGWYIQPAFLGLSLLLPVALIALVETAYKVSGMGALEHGVVVGLGFLSLAPVGLLGLHSVAPELVQPAPKVASAERTDSAAGESEKHVDVAPSATLAGPHTKEHHPDPSFPTNHRLGLQTEQEIVPTWGLSSDDDLSLCSTLLHPDASLGDLEEVFQADEWRTSAMLTLGRRYPDAAWLIDSLRDPGDFQGQFPEPPVSWRRITLGLSSAIYKATRQVGFEHLSEIDYTYPLNSEQLLQVPRLSLFPRAEIRSSLPTPIRDLHLTTVTFGGDAGSRDIEGLLAQLNAFTWSLLTEIALLDQTAGRDIAARDAVLASLAYINTYLEFARNTHPEHYKTLINSHSNRAGVVLLWDRAVCGLRLSGTEARLGINDIGLFPLVFRGDTPPEIDRLRAPAPAEHAPADHAPEEHAPAEHAPAEHAPEEHAPPDHAPTPN